MTASVRALQEAVQAELFVEVNALADKVDQLTTQLPAVLADIQGSANGVKAAAEQARVDFEAMGHALMNVMRRQVEEERAASVKANAEAAKATKSALDQFTKYFWLLCGLTGVNTLLVVVALLSGR